MTATEAAPRPPSASRAPPARGVTHVVVLCGMPLRTVYQLGFAEPRPGCVGSALSDSRPRQVPF